MGNAIDKPEEPDPSDKEMLLVEDGRGRRLFGGHRNTDNGGGVGDGGPATSEGLGTHDPQTKTDANPHLRSANKGALGGGNTNRHTLSHGGNISAGSFIFKFSPTAEKSLKDMKDAATKLIYVPKANEVYDRRLRTKFDYGCCTYLSFLVMVVILAFWTIPVSLNYEHVQFSRLYYSSENDESFTDYDKVYSVERIYQFLENTIIPASSLNDGDIGMGKSIVGGITLRQIRIKPSECEIAKRNKKCYSFFNRDNIDKSSFGPLTDPWKYKWTEGFSELYPSIHSVRGFLFQYPDSFGTGAFHTIIPTNETEARAMIKQLREERWIQESTRVVAINIGIANVDLGYVTSVEYVFDISPSNTILQISRFTSFCLTRITTESYAVFYAFFCLRLLIEFVNQIMDIRIRGFYNHFSLSWNVIEILTNIVFIFLASWIGVFIKYSTELLDKIEYHGKYPNNVQYVDFQTASFHYYMIESFIGFGCFLAILKVFKYLRIYNQFNTLWDAVSRASSKLLAFIAIFSVVLLSYTFFGYLSFGFTMRDYNTYSFSLLTTFQMLSGNVNYMDYVQAHPILSYFYLVSYMLFVFLILVNMFIAILNQYYDEQIHSQKYTEENKDELPPTKDTRETEKNADVKGESKTPAKEIKHYKFSLEDVDYDLFKRFEGVKPKIIFKENQDPMQLYQGKFVLLLTNLDHKSVELKNVHELMIESNIIPRTKMLPFLSNHSLIHFKSNKTSNPLVLTLRRVLDIKSTDLKGDELAELEKIVNSGDGFLYVVLNDYHMNSTMIQQLSTNLTLRLFLQVVLSIGKTLLISHVEVFILLREHVFSRNGGTNAALSDERISELLRQKCNPSKKSVGKNVKYVRFFELVRDLMVIYYQTSKDADDTPNFLHEAFRILQVLTEGDAVVDMSEDYDFDIGVEYDPQPIGAEGIDVSKYHDIMEEMAEYIHDGWTYDRLAANFSYGEKTEGTFHASMKKYEKLSDDDKSYDRIMGMQIIKVLSELGFECRSTGKVSGKEKLRKVVDNGMYKGELRLPSDYSISLYDEEALQIPPDVLGIILILAENAHDAYSRNMFIKGYKYGPKRNEETKERPSLRPFYSLTKEEQSSDIATSKNAIHFLLGKGFVIERVKRSRWCKLW